MAQEEIEYYSIGSRQDIVVSSSSLKHIDPEQGGSPQQFLAFFDENKEIEETKYLRIGKMIHKWAEDPESFHIAAVAKPAEKLGIVADAIIDWCKGNGEELTDQIYLDIARRCNYQAGYKDDTLIATVKKGAEVYIHELLEADSQGKIYLSEAEALTIEASCNAINKHPVAKELLFLQDNDFSEKRSLKEVPIFWDATEMVLEEEQTIKMKALLDDVTIDVEKKTITINDLKSTSSGAYLYQKTFNSYRTWRQLSFYQKAIIAWALQNGIDISGYEFLYNVIVVETNKQVQCVVWKVPSEWITRGTLNIRSLVKRIAIHKYTDNWNYSLEEVENGYTLTLPYTEE